MECITEKVEPGFERSFVPEQADLGDPDQVALLFEGLLNEDIGSPRSIEDWLLKWSELYAAISQEGALRYIRMTCQTDDREREAAFLQFIEEVEPKIKPLNHKLANKLLASPGLKDLDRDRYFVLLRDLENETSLFRQENIPLQTRDEKLSQNYQKITGAMTVEHEGAEQTLQQMAWYLELPDREQRKDAWEKVVNRRLDDCGEIEKLFDKMLETRREIAHNAGFENFRDYSMKKMKRFDYGVAECESFHRAVEDCVAPLYRKMQEQRRTRMGLSVLRPWDLRADPGGRPALKPFEKADELVQGCMKIFQRLHPELGGRFRFLDDSGLMDLESRKGKAPGAYSYPLEEHRLPFIFANAAGLDHDVRMLLHESGHAFHTLESRDEPLVFFREAPIEFAEVASMSMELLGGEHLECFYSAEDAARSRDRHAEQVVSLFCWIACVDAFQHWLYTRPGHSRDQRAGAWLELRQRFGGIEEFSGYERAREYEWHRQSHIFQSPFYYIEYGIAQVGALQVWERARKEGRAELDDYRKALSLGGSRPLPELFSAAGIKFDMSRETLEPLVRGIIKD